MPYNTRANKNRYIAGDHKVVCDQCALVYMRSECKKTWDNLLVCSECFDPKQPQLTVRGYTDKQSVRDARPPSSDSDIRFYLMSDGSVVDVSILEDWFDTMNYIVPGDFK